MLTDDCAMPLISWNESLSVGYEPIDEQHRRLIELINMLQDATTHGGDQHVMGDVLDGLIEYTRFHFATEERLMEAYKYPLNALHTKAHTELRRRVVALRGQFTAGKPVISVNVQLFLKDWLASHILRSDMALGSFLAAST